MQVGSHGMAPVVVGVVVVCGLEWSLLGRYLAVGTCRRAGRYGMYLAPLESSPLSPSLPGPNQGHFGPSLPGTPIHSPALQEGPVASHYVTYLYLAGPGSVPYEGDLNAAIGLTMTMGHGRAARLQAEAGRSFS